MAKTHYSHRLSRQFCQLRVPVAEVPVLCPSSLAVLLGVVLCAVRDCQQVGEHRLRHTLCAVGWHIRYDDVSFSGCRYVHHVVPRRQHPDVFQSW